MRPINGCPLRARRSVEIRRYRASVKKKGAATARVPIRESIRCQKLVATRKEESNPKTGENSSVTSRKVVQTVSTPNVAETDRNTQGSFPRIDEATAWRLINSPSRPMVSG